MTLFRCHQCKGELFGKYGFLEISMNWWRGDWLSNTYLCHDCAKQLANMIKREQRKSAEKYGRLIKIKTLRKLKDLNNNET